MVGCQTTVGLPPYPKDGFAEAEILASVIGVGVQASAPKRGVYVLLG